MAGTAAPAERADSVVRLTRERGTLLAMGALERLPHRSFYAHPLLAGRTLDATGARLGPLVPATVVADVHPGLDRLAAERAPAAGRGSARFQRGDYVGRRPDDVAEDAEDDDGDDEERQYAASHVSGIENLCDGHTRGSYMAEVALASKLCADSDDQPWVAKLQ